MQETASAAVIIPTHNRIQLLRKVLDSILAQTVKSEIFVMDDASSDGTGEIVLRDYPQVRYFREDKGKGPTFQRNKASRLTTADVLFTIDDDCVLVSPNTMQQTLQAFNHPRVAAVTLPFINILQDKTVHTAYADPAKIMVTYDYFGGMVAIRRDLYEAVGGYRSYMFIQIEEPDLSIRLLDAGYVVRLGWADPLEHMESPLRDHTQRDRQGPRNLVLFSYYNVPWPIFPLHLAGTTLLCLRHGLQTGHIDRVVRGLWQGYSGIFHELGKRKSVKQKTYHLTRMLRKVGSMPLTELETHLPSMREFAVETAQNAPSASARNQTMAG
ncbi:MAG: glycosyltransferase family 2 protein [Planctomycetota bacterium]|nr:glycosyltransferase family 2 protein [Planctomycetota bacterium]